MRDHPTPQTNKLLRKMKEGDGVPVGCQQWDALVKHARAMERMAYAYKVVAAAAMRPADDGKCPHGWDKRMSCSECNKAAGGPFGTIGGSRA